MLTCLLFLAASLSGPLYGFRWRTVERKGVDLIVALDCSRSMLASDIKPDRLSRAKREILDLLNRLTGDRVGLVAYAGTAFMQSPLTVDYAGFNIFLNALTPDYLPVGGTDVAGAIDTALESFDPESPAEKAVVLITDGEPTGGDPVEAAARAKEAGVRIFVIGVGSAEGAPVPGRDGGFRKDASGNIVLSRLGEETLKQIAKVSGGTYVRSVAGDMDWDVIYNKGIRGGMKAETLESGRIMVWEDRYQWPLALAIAALAAEILLPLGRRAAALLLLPLFLVPGPSPASAAGASGLVREGLGHYEAGRYDKALKSFIDAQVEEPGSPEIAYDLGNAYYRAGEFEEAMRNYQVAARDGEKQLRRDALFNHGNAAYRLGRLEEAIEKYGEVLTENPEDGDARKNLEFVKLQLEKKKQQKKNDSGEDERDSGSKDKDEKDKSDNSGGGKPGEPEKKEEGGAGDRRGNEKRQAQDEKQQARNNGEEADKEDGMNMAEETDGGEKRQTAGRRDEKRENTGAALRLNRLSDQPGKAMIPAYGKHRVEKDW